MSGPVGQADAPAVAADAGGQAAAGTASAGAELLAGRVTEVGGVPVRRALPRRGRRTVGPWCFVDHFGAAGAGVGATAPMRVGPHPHTGLQTVTWLLAGEVVHTDSLGSEQPIRPGQLNLMTAGRGVAHAEDSASSTPVHGAQLWVALPEGTRDGAPSFEHHAGLAEVDLGAVAATVLLGELGGERSPGRADWPIVGADLAGRGGTATVPLDPGFEHAVVVLDGSLVVGGRAVEPGVLAYLAPGRDELAVEASAGCRALLLGGRPFAEPVLMWWNFVARTRDEVATAAEEWNHGSDRFGDVASGLPRIPAPSPPWA